MAQNAPINQSQSLDYGLIAEEVAQIDPNLAIRDGKGQIESVRYNAINAMLLNEFLKDHRRVEEQQAAITDLKSVVAQQQKQFLAAIADQRKELEARLEEQESKIQRMSAQLETAKPVAQVVVNNR